MSSYLFNLFLAAISSLTREYVSSFFSKKFFSLRIMAENRIIWCCLAVLVTVTISSTAFFTSILLGKYDLGNLKQGTESDQYTFKGLYEKMSLMESGLKGLITNEINGLRSKVENEIHGLRNDLNSVSTTVKGLRSTVEGQTHEIKSLRNIFVSSQKGQSEAADSSLSVQWNGSHFACGTLAYSTRLQDVVVITNRHVVVDPDCARNITVRTKDNVDIPIARWFVLARGRIADIAYGQLAGPAPVRALNITSRADVMPGQHIWGISVQKSGLVALDGRVTSILKAPYHLETNVGGMPGFSGTGYVNYAGTLSVVHVGGKEAALRSDGDDDPSHDHEDTEYDLAQYSRDCLNGMRLATTGLASHIDACLDLVSTAAAINETIQRCVDGWSMLGAKTLAGQPPEFASSCASVFADHEINRTAIAKCEAGWRAVCGQNCAFIRACLSFATGEPLDGRAVPASRKECRAGWYGKYAGYAENCENYIRLRARNPQATSIAAWVIDHPPSPFVDRATQFPRVCN